MGYQPLVYLWLTPSRLSLLGSSCFPGISRHTELEEDPAQLSLLHGPFLAHANIPPNAGEPLLRLEPPSRPPPLGPPSFSKNFTSALDAQGLCQLDSLSLGAPEASAPFCVGCCPLQDCPGTHPPLLGAHGCQSPQDPALSRWPGSVSHQRRQFKAGTRFRCLKIANSKHGACDTDDSGKLQKMSECTQCCTVSGSVDPKALRVMSL